MAKKEDLLRILEELTPFQIKHAGKDTQLKAIKRDLKKLSEVRCYFIAVVVK